MLGTLGGLTATVIRLYRHNRQHPADLPVLIKSPTALITLLTMSIVDGVIAMVVTRALQLNKPPDVVAFVVGMFAHDRVFDLIGATIKQVGKDVPEMGSSLDHKQVPRMGSSTDPKEALRRFFG